MQDCNDFNVAVHVCETAIRMFAIKLNSDPDMLAGVCRSVTDEVSAPVVVGSN